MAGAMSKKIVSTHEPYIIPDTEADEPQAQFAASNLASEIRSWMGVPLTVKDQLIGLLVLFHLRPGYYSEERAKLALAFANQVAVAIENASLYRQAKGLAALQERQKLARELHDSVSQALYGIALGTRTALTLLDRASSDKNTKDLNEPLNYVLSLAEAGLAEMRALILELRPESLQSEGLVAALSKQVASLHARHHIEVRSCFCEEPDVSLAIKETLYRVAQEALHNIVKHARASLVTVSLDGDGGTQLMLLITDNGCGFDATGEFPGHLGLRSMRERVTGVHGNLTVESLPGAGTRIQARVPAVNHEEVNSRPLPFEAHLT
jgi:signal transduction histidine kinase